MYQVSISALMGDTGTDLLFRNNSINKLYFVMSLKGTEKQRGGCYRSREMQILLLFLCIIS